MNLTLKVLLVYEEFYRSNVYQLPLTEALIGKISKSPVMLTKLADASR